MRAISDNIVELSFSALVAFFLWGFGYIIMQESKQTKKQTYMMYEACISAGKQWIKGSCVR